MKAVALVALVGCGLDVGASQPWVPIDEITGRLAPDLAPAIEPAPVPSGSVRVVTWNIDEENNPGTDLIAAAITSDPDLAAAGIFMFEEEEAYPDEGRTRSAKLAELLGGVGFVYVPARPKADGTHGLAIMSRYPIDNVMKMDLPATNGNPRIAISADITMGADVLHIIDVHLETFINADQRLAQLRPVVIDPLPVVLVGGDFNMGFVQWLATGVPVVSGNAAYDQAPAVESYMKAVGYAEPSADSGPTSHAYGEQVKLDAFFTRGLDVTFGAVDHVGPSDHWPMWMDVQLQ